MRKVFFKGFYFFALFFIVILGSCNNETSEESSVETASIENREEEVRPPHSYEIPVIQSQLEALGFSTPFREQLALDVTLEDTYGELRNINPIAEDETAEVGIIILWATWCETCSVSLSQLNALSKKYEGVVKVIAITVADSAQSEPWITNFVKARNYNFPVIIDKHRVAVEFYLVQNSITSIPTAFIIDSKGSVSAVNTLGVSKGWNSPEMHKLIDSYLEWE